MARFLHRIEERIGGLKDVRTPPRDGMNEREVKKRAGGRDTETRCWFLRS